MSAGGKQAGIKGANGERELCKMLTEMFGASFIRSAHSGAFVGGKNARRKATLSAGQVRQVIGDIVPPDGLPRLVVESKFYRDFPFHQLLRQHACPLLDGWIQQTLDVIDADTVWMICLKVNLKGWYVAVPDHSAYRFDSHCVYIGRHGRIQIADLAEFFHANHPVIRKLAAPRPPARPSRRGLGLAVPITGADPPVSLDPAITGRILRKRAVAAQPAA